jgi:hypothetical protein
MNLFRTLAMVGLVGVGMVAIFIFICAKLGIEPRLPALLLVMIVASIFSVIKLRIL